MVLLSPDVEEQWLVQWVWWCRMSGAAALVLCPDPSVKVLLADHQWKHCRQVWIQRDRSCWRVSGVDVDWTLSEHESWWAIFWRADPALLTAENGVCRCDLCSCGMQVRPGMKGRSLICAGRVWGCASRGHPCPCVLSTLRVQLMRQIINHGTKRRNKSWLRTSNWI